MNDLATYIDPDKMIDAAKYMQDLAAVMSDDDGRLGSEIQSPQVFGSSLGQGDVPGGFHLKKVASLEHSWDPTGDWAWFSTVYCEDQVFSTSGEAPWMPKLHTMWREAITNRVRESQQITAELDLLSHAIVEYLRDATDIDLENAGLILDVLPDEGPEWV